MIVVVFRFFNSYSFCFYHLKTCHDLLLFSVLTAGGVEMRRNQSQNFFLSMTLDALFVKYRNQLKYCLKSFERYCQPANCLNVYVRLNNFKTFTVYLTLQINFVLNIFNGKYHRGHFLMVYCNAILLMIQSF